MDNLGGIGDFIEDAANTAGRSGIWGIFLHVGCAHSRGTCSSSRSD